MCIAHHQQQFSLTDPPNPPINLHQNELANTESSAVVQWEPPFFNGNSTIRYTVTVNCQISQSVRHEDADNIVFPHNISGLIYNTEYNVSVTAINSCGLSSEPANTSVFIDARGQGY